MSRKPLQSLQLKVQNCCNDIVLRKRHHSQDISIKSIPDDIFQQKNNNLKNFWTSEVASPPSKCRKTCFIIRRREMKRFFSLLDEDPVITDFLSRETCYKISDKYLLAMVFAYFKRAEYTLREYNRINFFTALYLANDIEEDEEDLKYEIFPWALGCQWLKKYSSFLKKKDYLWKRMGYRAIVSRKCCDELMAIEPQHSLWSRTRPEYHGGAIRSYTRRDEEFRPRGPFKSPQYCALCDDEQYNSLDSTLWYLSSSSGDSDTDNVLCGARASKPRKTTVALPAFDDVWPCVEE